ncbi:MAG TPA: helix-turn-helix transcriptional regulator, partial [Vicinamibacterales bacterium]|nr:helix-turn-helix transcriptional regulator [Vicinamibacterales bacterium]
MDSSADAEILVRENVKALMDLRQMNQGDLARELGLSQAWVSKRLSGKEPPLGSRFQVADLTAIARVFGVTPAALVLPSREW